MNMTTITPGNSSAPRARWVRGAWLLAGGMGLTALGIAAGLAWRPAPPADIAPPGSIATTKASLAADEAVVEPGDKAPGDATHANTGTPVPPAATGTTRKPQQRNGHQGTSVASSGQVHGENATTPSQTAAVCASCGVVEGVREVTQKGQGTGLGAVAGGVLGGAVGNQMGRGNGRTAMTVLGAIGGGLAGHEIEKRARSETLYDVRVRMDDGSVRTLRQKAAPAQGTRVTVEGNVLRTLQGSASQESGARTMRTSAEGAGA